MTSPKLPAFLAGKFSLELLAQWGGDFGVAGLFQLEKKRLDVGRGGGCLFILQPFA
jgi:hypothetical protein